MSGTGTHPLDTRAVDEAGNGTPASATRCASTPRSPADNTVTPVPNVWQNGPTDVVSGPDANSGVDRVD